MKSLLIYSSVTGNTKKVAMAMAQEIEDGEILAIQDVEAHMLHHFDVIWLGYWVDKGLMDAASRALVPQLQEHRIVLFGTLGAAMNTNYYDRVKKTVASSFKQQNILGHFLCQGRVSEAVIERYRSRSKQQPQDEHIKAQLDNYEAGMSHPDAMDLEKARAFARSLG